MEEGPVWECLQVSPFRWPCLVYRFLKYVYIEYTTGKVGYGVN